jgi:anti-anti-sigma factor
MRYDCTIGRDLAILRLHEEADQWELAPFERQLEQCLAASGGRAVLDLLSVPWLTSSMISLLITEHRHAAAMGGGIVLAGAKPLVLKSLDLLGVDRILRCAPTVEEAMELLTPAHHG